MSLLCCAWQLCINYANEKLQQLFNQHIFQQEQDEYEAEGIDWITIEFNNNRECVELLEKVRLPRGRVVWRRCPRGVRAAAEVRRVSRVWRK